MNKADTIRLNQRWIRETEEKIEVLNEAIAIHLIDIKGYALAISGLEEEEQ